MFLFQYFFFCPNEMFKWVTKMSLLGLKQLDLAPYWSLQGSRQVSIGRLSKHHKIYRCIFRQKKLYPRKTNTTAFKNKLPVHIFNPKLTCYPFATLYYSNLLSFL